MFKSRNPILYPLPTFLPSLPCPSPHPSPFHRALIRYFSLCLTLAVFATLTDWCLPILPLVSFLLHFTRDFQTLRSVIRANKRCKFLYLDDYFVHKIFHVTFITKGNGEHKVIWMNKYNVNLLPYHCFLPFSWSLWSSWRILASMFPYLALHVHIENQHENTTFNSQHLNLNSNPSHKRKGRPIKESRWLYWVKPRAIVRQQRTTSTAQKKQHLWNRPWKSIYSLLKEGLVFDNGLIVF